VERECIAIRFSETLKRHICVDTKNHKKIFEFLEKQEEQFQDIADQILEQKHPYFRGYKKLKYNYKKTTEMRFNVGRGNEILYCQETINKHGQLCVVMSKYWGKKSSDEIDKKIKAFIDPIEDDYVYTIDYTELEKQQERERLEKDKLEKKQNGQ
jgi:hypothetical protein